MSCAPQAWTNFVAVHKMHGKEVADTVEKDIEKALKRGRIMWIECKFLEALVFAESQHPQAHSQAASQIDDIVGTFEKAEIVITDKQCDINEFLWQRCEKVQSMVVGPSYS